MDAIKITGQVTHVSAEEKVGPNNLAKRTFRIETDEKYPQKHEIDGLKEAADAIGDLEPGQTVTALCNLRGRYWEKGDRCFTSLALWKFDNNSSSSVSDEAERQNAINAEQHEDDDDELPF